MRHEEDVNSVDQSIVKSLYSLEVKLKVGQQRANNWQDENRKGKAAMFNQRVDHLRDDNNQSGTKAA